ncbi:MAG TPA: efflux RND transporter periplasmic adaptor subunit [Cyclobacteriaceae bacterium]|nr:efflux RND transporter periplasmic adaptor subunit [Cyclobacteriaceae bacterium]
MKTVFRILLVLILVISFVGTGYFLYRKSQKPPVIYETESPDFQNIIKKTVATGSIVPRKEIALKSQVSGVVEIIYVEPGQIVKQGDKVAKIRIIPNVVALNNAEANLKTAVINFKNAEKELDRQRGLFNDKIISEFDYNQFVLAYNLRKQEVESAENNLELVKEGASKKSGTVSNVVNSTADGMILDVPVKEGTFVIESNTFNEGTTISSVANMNDLIFQGKVDESEVGKLKEGMELQLKIGALDKDAFNAYLEYIAPKGLEDQGAIQFEIKAAIKLQPGIFLRAGYSANADIVLDKRDSVLSIRESNLVFEDNKTFVEVEKAIQQFEKREVKTGLSDEIHIEILEGLTREEKIKKI